MLEKKTFVVSWQPLNYATENFAMTICLSISSHRVINIYYLVFTQQIVLKKAFLKILYFILMAPYFCTGVHRYFITTHLKPPCKIIDKFLDRYKQYIDTYSTYLIKIKYNNIKIKSVKFVNVHY